MGLYLGKQIGEKDSDVLLETKRKKDKSHQQTVIIISLRKISFSSKGLIIM